MSIVKPNSLEFETEAIYLQALLHGIIFTAKEDFTLYRSFSFYSYMNSFPCPLAVLSTQIDFPKQL